ncbi:MAG: Hpt domain-containing protein [Desulfobulbaceae bacterium]|nr:Hpt domain-containing protein [Desulfobulbaceae bacterium]
MGELKWDRLFALEQAGDDEELLEELLDLFHDSSSSDMDKIRDSASQGDSQGVGDAAHSIKGAAASLGIDGIRDVAASLEQAGRDGDLKGAEPLVVNLVRLLQEFKSAT